MLDSLKIRRLLTYRGSVLVLTFVFLAAGGLLAVYSCAKAAKPVSTEMLDSELSNGNNGFSERKGANKFNRYQGLEKVILPEGTPEQIKDYCGFTVSFNKDNHTPNYVSWELLDSEVTYDVERSNNFWQDMDLEGCPAHYDYTRSGYDRGHMCPAADQKWSVEAMNDCFVMANMCPQDHNLNGGAWNTLENKERQWAKRDGAVIIVAGPVYTEPDTKRIGDIGVRVPGAFFKAFLAPYVEKPRAIAFVYPNMDATGNMENYAMSIDELEKILGYDFFSSLPDDIEEAVEAEFSFKEWNRNR